MHLLAWQPCAGFLARHENVSDPADVSQCFINEYNNTRKADLLEIAESHNVSLAQIATAWVVQQTRCHAIIGTKSLLNWQSAQASLEISTLTLSTYYDQPNPYRRSAAQRRAAPRTHERPRRARIGYSTV